LDQQKTVIGKRRIAAATDSRAAYQNRRQEISQAAVRVFNRLGYTGASLSAVATEMGIDRATLYYYFSSKEQLFDEVVRAVLEDNDQLARTIADSSASPAAKLRELVSALMVSYAVNYPMLFIYIREDLTHVSDKRSDWSGRMRELNKSIQQAVMDIVDQGFADGSFRQIGSSKIVAYGILGMLNWSHRWYRPERPEASEDIGRTFAEMVLSGLEVPPAS
jgi:AcrR family transcriptional regulator